MLDTLPAWARHLVLLLINAIVTAVAAAAMQWAQADLPAVLASVPVLAPLAGTIVTLVVAALTPLTRQYGVGSAAEYVEPADDAAQGC